MKSVSVFFFSVAFFVFILSLGWIIEGDEFFLYKFFAPKQEEVRREVFERSRAFNQGMIQELQNMQFEYVKEKDPNAKKALASIILHRASGFNIVEEPSVPPDLRSFIEKLRNEKTEVR